MTAETTKKKDYESQLTIGHYILKQIYQHVVLFGGMLGGAWAGLVAGARWFPQSMSLDKAQTFATKKPPIPPAQIEQVTQAKVLIRNQGMWERIGLHKIPGLKIVPTEAGLWTGLTGMFIGSTISALILGYGHWKKEKMAQLQVDEITKDISDIEVFKKTDPELKKENTRLWAMLREKEQRTGEAPRQSWREQVNTATTAADRRV